MKSEKKTLVVLGCPRSGTSVTSGLLTILGVDMGDVPQPDPENPTGYYEDKAFSALIADIFEAADPAADGFNPPSLSSIREQQPKFEDRARQLIKLRSANANSNIWGWKVTTTIFMIDLFLPNLNHPYFVIVLRNPLDIANSMVNYTKRKALYEEISLLQGLKLAIQYYDCIFSFLELNPMLPKHYIAYEDIVSKPQLQFKELARFLGLEITHDRLRRVQRFVTSDMTLERRKFRLISFLRRMKNYISKCLRNPTRIPDYVTLTIRSRGINYNFSGRDKRTKH